MIGQADGEIHRFFYLPERREMLLQIIAAAIMAAGLSLILLDAFRVPCYAVSKAVHNLGKQQKKKTSVLEIWLRKLSVRLAGKLRLNEYRRMQLEADLRTSDISMTPEQYTANAIVKGLVIGVFALPALAISGLMAVFFLFCGVVVALTEYKKLGRKIRDRRRRIENELPGLVSNIQKTLAHSRDVLGILDAYREQAGEELKRELEITVADMRSGNDEVALTRLASRVGSSMMTDVTRGLIGVARGDNTSVYWAQLALRFDDYGRQLLRADAEKAPKRVRRLSMVLLICFMLIYVVVIAHVLLSSLGGLAW